MSYIRAGHPLIYVEDISKDYIYSDGEEIVEVCGNLSGSSTIEILCERWKTDDMLLKEYLITKLAERLNVKLRDKPLTHKEQIEMSNKLMKKFEEENNDFLS